MGYPPLPLPRELPQRLPKSQPWITRIAPNCAQLNLTLGAATGGRNDELSLTIPIENPYGLFPHAGGRPDPPDQLHTTAREPPGSSHL